MEAVPARARIAWHPRQGDAEQLTGYCWRPRCRKVFRYTAGPGRAKPYCSETCRRAAEKELRQARSRLAHFEALVGRFRIDVAVFARPGADGADAQLPPSIEAQQTAENAVRRAAGVLVFANPDDPAVDELRKLYNAVVPVILSSSLAG